MMVRYGYSKVQALLLLLLLRIPFSQAKVRIILLAGQSNVRGWADVGHLLSLAQEPGSSYGYIVQQDGAFRSRSDVKIVSNSVPGVYSNLTVGYGNGDEESQFGPELGFGWTFASASVDPVLIVKVGVGGSALAFTWRPPSAGTFLGGPAEGRAYRELVDMTWEAASNIGNIFEGETEYEISGFIWFQGWFDAFNDDFRDEYFVNLIHLVTDIQDEFGRPDLPVIIGELGQEGLEVSLSSRIEEMRNTQRVAAELLGEQVVFVPTHPYVVSVGDRYDEIYHYYGRADTMMDIGTAFGNAMMDLLDFEPEASASPSVSTSEPSLVPTAPAPSLGPSATPSFAPFESDVPTVAQSTSVPPSEGLIQTDAPSGSFFPSIPPSTTQSPSGSFLPSNFPSPLPSGNPSGSYLPSSIPSSPSDCLDTFERCTDSSECCSLLSCYVLFGQSFCANTTNSVWGGGVGNKRGWKSAIPVP